MYIIPLGNCYNLELDAMFYFIPQLGYNYYFNIFFFWRNIYITLYKFPFYKRTYIFCKIIFISNCHPIKTNTNLILN